MATTVADLHDQLANAGLPVVTVRQTGATVSAAYSRALTAPEQATATGILAAWAVPTPLQEARAVAHALLDSGRDGAWKLLRAIALVSLDEINTLRQWETEFKAAVAASTTLADLKTRVAALPALPQRTKAQLLTAVGAKVDSGDPD